MRKTKIICTIGPSCSDEKTIKEMCLAGMNVARMNFSHNTHKEHLERIIKQAKRKILDLAIHGKLVPQDPNDEPALELLITKPKYHNH